MTPAPTGSDLEARAHHAYRTGLVPTAREAHLSGLLWDTLTSPGALTRLRLGLIAGEALGLPGVTTRPLATSLEYFHTASLLLDDLPCMDDATLRRGRPCAHLVHGEGSTILGALAFINRGYRLAWEAIATAPEARRASAADHIEHCLGCAGILDGQCLDLHFSASDRSPRAVLRVALGKTVALLRLSLLTPALLASASPLEQRLLNRLSVSWGLAYQITDDFCDQSPVASSGKTPGRDSGRGRPNLVLAVGRPAAAARLLRLLTQMETTFVQLLSIRPGWRALAPLIDAFGVAAARHLSDRALSRCA